MSKDVAVDSPSLSSSDILISVSLVDVKTFSMSFEIVTVVGGSVVVVVVVWVEDVVVSVEIGG